MGSASVPFLLLFLPSTEYTLLAFPGLIAIGISLCLLFIIQDYPTITKHLENRNSTPTMDGKLKETKVKDQSRAKGSPKNIENTKNYLSLVYRSSLSPEILTLCWVYFVVTILRVFMSDWSLFYISESTQETSASNQSIQQEDLKICFLLQQIGAVVGSLLGGSISDSVFAGRRGPVMNLYLFGLTLTFSLFTLQPLVNFVFLRSKVMISKFQIPLLVEHDVIAPLLVNPFVEKVLIPTFSTPFRLIVSSFLGPLTLTRLYGMYFFLGFFAFTPHMLSGLAAREWCDSSVAQTVAGVVKLAGQIGGVLAGAPMGYFITERGWGDIVSMITLLLLITYLLTLRIHATTKLSI
eukprot:g217.t1